MKWFRALALAAAMAPAAPALAQQSIEQGSIGGRVLDPSGAAVPGAVVSARHVDTNVATDVTTDLDGRFRVPYLRVGSYELTASLDGFRTTRMAVTVRAASAFDVTIQLALASVDAAVTVVAESPVIEAARSQLAGTISSDVTARLPLNGRNFLELTLLVPGVAPTNISNTQLFPETSAVPGITLSVASQRNLSNNFIVDGLSANDDAAALSGMTYGVDALEQVQVVTSGGHAELGRALGGYVNVVTRSGTNAREGGAYGFARDDRLTAANPLLGRSLPMRQWQYGASAGGPLVRDRAFYFVNAEQRRLDQTGLVTISDANAAAINTRLAAAGYPGPRVTTGLYENPVRTSNLLTKIDYQVSPRASLGVRYSVYAASADNARGAGGLSAPTASSGLDNLDQALAAHGTFTLSSRTVFETRAQITRSELEAPPSDPIGPAVSIAGVGSFGTLSSSPTSRSNRLYQLVTNLSHHAGTHALRAGADLLYNDSVIGFPRAIRGSYSFPSLGAFLAGSYSNNGFTQTFGATDVAQTNPNVGLYAQDEWHAGGGVTINLGLRYDLQWLESIDTDTNNISPRVGVAWSPGGSAQTVVRGSAGLFFDRVPLRALANALLSAGNSTDLSQLRQIAVVLSPGQTGAPVFPATLTAPAASATLPSLTTMDREIESAYSRQASLEVERQIGAAMTASAAYQYTNGRNLLVNINQNVPACVASGGNNGCRPNAGYANNSQYSAAGTSTYHGLSLSVAHRPSRFGSYRLSYTLAKAMNDTGEFFFSGPIDPTDISKDWGRSDNDRRHQFVAFASARLPLAIDVSGIVQAYSAPPFNITSGVTTIQGTAARPIVDGDFIPRNAGTGTAFFSLSGRIARTFEAGPAAVEVMLEGFNLTNHRNVVTRNATFGTGVYPSNPLPRFGEVTAYGEPRALQLGLRVRFR